MYESWSSIWMRALFFVGLAAAFVFLTNCGHDPCLGSDYTTSGLCVHLEGYELEQDDVDYVVGMISDVANRHGLHGVDMAQRLEEVGPVPMIMVPSESLGTTEDGIPIIGCTNYTVLMPSGNDRLGGYTVRVEDGQGIEMQLLTVAHELLHIMGPEYIGTSVNTNADHAEPYMFRLWGILYDKTYSPRHTVEGVAWTYITEYLVAAGRIEDRTP